MHTDILVNELNHMKHYHVSILFEFRQGKSKVWLLQIFRSQYPTLHEIHIDVKVLEMLLLPAADPFWIFSIWCPVFRTGAWSQEYRAAS